jgi:peroxiredoxin
VTERVKKMTKNHWIVGFLIVLMITGGVVFIRYSMADRKSGNTGAAVAGSAKKIGTAIGAVAPDFELTGTDGSPVALRDLRGQPAVLVFWTAWCPVCREEAPRFNELASQYGPRGVRVLGINIQDSQARTESGIKDFPIRYPVARDPDASVTRRYRVTGTPTIVFLDRNGVVSYVGNRLPDDYKQRLDAMVSQKG